MDPERFKRIEDVFGLALERAGEDRARLLDALCGGDDALRREVDALLAEHDRLTGFLAEPARVATALSPLTDPEASPAPAAPPRALAAGAVVDGKYRVEALLGRGGMGEVYRATQLSLDRPVAVKVIRSEHAASAEMLVRFRREARAVARLRHPNIVTVHEYGVQAGVGAFLVMEHLEGRSLRQELLARGRLPAAEAAALMRDVCAAVAAAHAAGIVHRDLKPDNVFLEAGSGRVKVLDFGIAKLAGRAGHATVELTAGGVVGTPFYMAPEQAAGDEVDGRTDVYAVGCMLYELVAGRPPFTGGTRARVLEQQLTAAPRPPSALAPDLPGSLEAAILRALAKRPGERFQTADELLLALGAGPAPATGAAAGRGDTGDRVLATTADGRVHTEAASGHNLPRFVGSFVGRAGEVARVGALLAGGRLVTLVGPGGIGKTRLAVEAADAARHRYPGGAWIAELAPVSDPRLVAEAVAGALGVRAEPGEPAGAALTRDLRARELLVVLDNCEHLVEACATLAAGLLHACPGVRVLATSREALGVEGEMRCDVPPLGVPAGVSPAEAPEASESVRLFVERARAVRPGFALSPRDVAAAAEICRELDGIPLAIELAAARARSLSPEQILGRLRDRFRLLAGVDRTALPRHRTLRAAIDWSHDLLTEPERLLFAGLSVFAGGWDLEAAEALCAGAGGGVAREDVVDLLARLVDKSLVVAADGRDGAVRFSMLETIRKYAADRHAEGATPSAARGAHTAWFLDLAERARAHWQGPDEGAWLTRLDADADNLRAALGRETAADGDPRAALRLCEALTHYWTRRSRIGEGRRWLEAVLARGDALSPAERAEALGSAGHLATHDGDYAAARRALEESAALRRGLGEPGGLCRALGSLAGALLGSGEFDRGAEVAAEAVEIARGLGDWHRLSWAMHFAGSAEMARGRDAAAERILTERIALCRGHESHADLAITLVMASSAVWRLGRREAALAMLDEGEAIARREGFVLFAAWATFQRGALALLRGDAAGAVASHEAALRVFWEQRSRPGVGNALDHLSRGLSASGHHRAAMRAAGAAAALHDAMGVVYAPRDRAEQAESLAAARDALGAEAEALFAEGRATPLADAVAEALEAANN